MHGALFLALKTDGNIRHAARHLATTLCAVAIVVGARLPDLTQVDTGQAATDVTALLTAVALLGALVFNTRTAMRAGRSRLPGL